MYCTPALLDETKGKLRDPKQMGFISIAQSRAQRAKKKKSRFVLKYKVWV